MTTPRSPQVSNLLTTQIRLHRTGRGLSLATKNPRVRQAITLLALVVAAAVVWDIAAPLRATHQAIEAFNRRDPVALATLASIDSLTVDYFDASTGPNGSSDRAVSLSVRPEVLARLRSVANDAIVNPHGPLEAVSVDLRLRERWIPSGRLVGIRVRTPQATIPAWLRLRRDGMSWSIVGVDSAPAVVSEAFGAAR